LQPMVFIASSDDWMQRQLLSRTSAWGEWTMLGGQMHIWPVMDVGTTATFAYLDKNCVKLTSGGVGSEFMSDTDSFLLDERLLKLAMIWQWKAQKGSPYAEDMASYETALAVASGHDSPSPIIIDRLPISAGVRTAYPWMVPT
jgi:hypothetical protein